MCELFLIRVLNYLFIVEDFNFVEMLLKKEVEGNLVKSEKMVNEKCYGDFFDVLLSLSDFEVEFSIVVGNVCLFVFCYCFFD